MERLHAFIQDLFDDICENKKTAEVIDVDIFWDNNCVAITVKALPKVHDHVLKETIQIYVLSLGIGWKHVDFINISGNVYDMKSNEYVKAPNKMFI